MILVKFNQLVWWFQPLLEILHWDLYIFYSSEGVKDCGGTSKQFLASVDKKLPLGLKNNFLLYKGI